MIIRTRVYAWVHRFALSIYHERAFSSLPEGIFERYKRRVDDLLANRCGDALAKVPSISDRLVAGDVESISHALSTCRRIIDSFADAVYPPREDAVDIGGEQLQVGAQQTKNRLRVYVYEHTTSDSRRKKLRRALTDLYERVSTGVHSDVTLAEAQGLFLETYLFLGEVLELGDLPANTQANEPAGGSTVEANVGIAAEPPSGGGIDALGSHESAPATDPVDDTSHVKAQPRRRRPRG